MPTFAAVDIGSNSVRLKIARLIRRRLTVVHEDREVTRLGRSAFESGALSPETMAATVKVLQRFHRATQKHHADVVRVVGTSALRDARNSREFSNWVKSVTGWQVEIISGLEEGRLIHLGISSNVSIEKSRVLLVDLGGGSCEFTVSINGHIKHMVSLPLGAVRLTEDFLHHDPPKKVELVQLKRSIAQYVSRIRNDIVASKVQFAIATSGTAAALASLAAGLDSKFVQNRSLTVPTLPVVKIAANLSKLSAKQRAALKGLGPKRSEIIIAGAMVFADFLTQFGLRGFRYFPLGLRDGLLAQMAAEVDDSTLARRQIESERQDALHGIANHYSVDLEFAGRVRSLAKQLFGGLRAFHQLPDEYEEWIAAAAMLHEVGHFVNRSGRHRHSYYIIANSDIFGYSPQERLIIAAIARYVGKSHPTPQDRPLRLLLLRDQLLVPKAVVLLRIARALDQGRRGMVTAVRPRGQKRKVILQITANTSAELELWALEKEKEYFRQIFGAELDAELI